MSDDIESCWCCDTEGPDPCHYCPEPSSNVAAHNPPTLADTARMFHTQDRQKRCLMCDGLQHWVRHRIETSEGDRQEAFCEMLSQLVGQ